MKWTDEIIDDYILGQLSAVDRVEFERLLESDASARERLSEARLLLEMLESSAPEVPSQRMWQSIRSQISQTVPVASPSWMQRLVSWLARPQMRMGMAGVFALLLVVVGLRHLPTQAPSMAQVQPQAETVPEVRNKAAAKPMAAARQRPAVASLKMDRDAAPAAKMAKHEPTEVEKALSEQDLDGVIATLLRQRQTATQLANIGQPSRPGGAGPASLAAASAAPQESQDNGVQTVSYGGPAMPTLHDQGGGAQGLGALPAAQSRVDANGFWDFHIAASALNRRDWLTATRELQAASDAAPEAAERAFAQSTLQLLSAGGQPVVAKVDLGESRELNVQSAARWQVFVDDHVARYFGGVVARMPGLRSEGDELVLDMAFDRASFSPGTRFIRLAADDGGVLSQVKDAQGAVVDSNEFRAPKGADYLLRANELRLK